MPHPIDAASKHMFDGHPADWVFLGELPPGLLETVDADLSAVSRAADKLVRVVFLLRPEAFGPGITGKVHRERNEDHRLDFTYKLVKVWEIPVGPLLAGGLGTLPLAPISRVSDSEVPGVIDAMRRRLESEVPTEEAKELWTETRILMGLRWPPEIVGQLLRGVQGMKDRQLIRKSCRKASNRASRKASKRAWKWAVPRDAPTRRGDSFCALDRRC